MRDTKFISRHKCIVNLFEKNTMSYLGNKNKTIKNPRLNCGGISMLRSDMSGQIPTSNILHTEW